MLLLGTFAVGTLGHGSYRYMSDLQVLKATVTGHGPHNVQLATPLIAVAWEHALRFHSDPAISCRASGQASTWAHLLACGQAQEM